jgi:nucleotide-binding universal stress UspA family protein
MENIDAAQRGIVVVGVDGSAGAREAVRWALAEARLRQTRLRVVHAWTFDYQPAGGAGYGYYGYPYVGDELKGTPYGLDGLRQAAEALVERTIFDEVADANAVEIERHVVEGSPVDVLINAVEEGDLLVVGSRGRGGFAGLLLGSVSQQCVHHAPCPVVVVRPVKPSSSSAKPTRGARREGVS